MLTLCMPLSAATVAVPAVWAVAAGEKVARAALP
jgi:hypothetical protein